MTTRALRAVYPAVSSAVSPLHAAMISMALSVVAIASTSCTQTAVSTSNNLEKPSDVVLIRAPSPDGSQEHSYVVVSNPDIEQLRILDLSTGTFLVAPNGYFPLSVRVGPATRRLASAAGHVFALDSVEGKVYVIRTAEDAQGPAFSVVETFAVPRAAAGMAAVTRSDDPNHALVFVTVPDTGTIQCFDVDTATGTVTATAAATLKNGLRPSEITVAVDENLVLVTDSARGTITGLRISDAQTALAEAVTAGETGLWPILQIIDASGPLSRISTGYLPINGSVVPVAAAIRRDASEVTLWRIDGGDEQPFQIVGRLALPASPLTLYIPDQRPESSVISPGACCSTFEEEQESTSWFAVTSASGSIYYVHVNVASEALDSKPYLSFFDTDTVGPSARVTGDLNTNPVLWAPAEGGDAFRPTMTLTAIENSDVLAERGTTPFLPNAASLVLTYEGTLPLASHVATSLQDQGNQEAILTVLGGLTWQERDVQENDVVVLQGTARDAAQSCNVHGTVNRLDGHNVFLSEITGDVSACVSLLNDDSANGGAAVDVVVTAKEAFSVVEDSGTYFGRVRLQSGAADPVASGETLELPEMRVTLQAAASGKPLAGSRLLLPIDGRNTPAELTLSRQSTLGTVGFGAAGALPGALVGGEVLVAGATAGTVEARRRMIVASNAALFSFIEPSNLLGEVLIFR